MFIRPLLVKIGSLYYFSSISMHLEWKKWRNQLTGSFLLARPSLVKQGLKPSRSILMNQRTLFGGKTLSISTKYLLFYQTKTATLSCNSNLQFRPAKTPDSTPVREIEPKPDFLPSLIFSLSFLVF